MWNSWDWNIWNPAREDEEGGGGLFDCWVCLIVGFVWLVGCLVVGLVGLCVHYGVSKIEFDFDFNFNFDFDLEKLIKNFDVFVEQNLNEYSKRTCYLSKYENYIL